ncbi:MAG: LacI family transcriptional regulator [Spirochaetaceae bacterium]|nr:LacI family transcriptional regulator [Spirochaetaceae bacterium]
MKQATLADIAASVGVTPATVSYYFSGRKKISAPVAEKITEAVKKLNYTPIHAAPRKGLKKIINMCVSMENGDLSDNIYYLGLMNGIMDCLAEDGYQLMFSRLVYGDSKSHSHFLKSLELVDGIILCNPRKDHRFEDEFQERNIPFVILGASEKTDAVFYVDVDMRGIGFQGADYFLARGHRKILYLNMPETMTQSQHRLDGFRMAYAQYALVFNEQDHFYAPAGMENAFELVKKLLSENRRYTAAVTANEILAQGVIRAARELKIDIPGKLEVLSMGGTVLGICAVPSLTVIDFNSYRHGHEAAKLLLEILHRKRVTPFHLILPGSLVERGSTKGS